MKNLKFLTGSMLIILIAFLFYTSYGLTSAKSIKAAGCKCYANGTSYSPGSDLCMGGFKARCIAKTGVGESARDCGWDYLLDKDRNKIPCK